MTSERQFDALLRSWLEESAPSGQPQGLLEAVVTATGHTRPRPAWLVRLLGEPMPETDRPGMNRFAPFGLVATAIVVMLLIGIALFVRLSPDVGPSPIPGPTHSATPDPNHTPDSTEQGAATWTATGNMIEARMDFTATRLPDGKVLVVGGDRGLNAVPRAMVTAELYDPASGTWTATGSLLTGRYRHSATLLPNGTVLVAGGNVGSSAELGNGCCLASAELYDPSTGTWTATGSMVDARVAHTATLLLDGTVLVAGGDSAHLDGTSPGAELYDPISRSWTATGAMIDSGSARFAHTATLLPNGKVLVVGGTSANAAPELYDPSSGSWSSLQCVVGIQFALGRCNDPVVWGAAVLLPNGKVLAIGAAGAMLYDPVTGSWTATAAMKAGELAQAAVLLLNGEVLVAGGSAELFDPRTGSWTVTVRPVGVRSWPTATLLVDGRVLVAGGFVGSFDLISLASAELFDPGRQPN